MKVSNYYKMWVLISFSVMIVSCDLKLTDKTLTPTVESNSVMADKVKNDIDQWKPAVFKGIKVGVDSREFALKAFGKPIWSGEPEDQNKQNPEIWDNFNNVDDFHKSITVMSSIKDGKILMIESHQKNITLDDVIRLLGDDYKKTSYSIIVCDKTKPESDELIESFSDSDLNFIEYRNQGIVLLMDSSQKTVHDIQHSSNPIVTTKTPCK